MTHAIETHHPARQGPRGLWFVVTYGDDGEVVAFEEHDGYQGGPMRIPEGKTPADYLVDRVIERGGRWDEAKSYATKRSIP